MPYVGYSYCSPINASEDPQIFGNFIRKLCAAYEQKVGDIWKRELWKWANVNLHEILLTSGCPDLSGKRAIEIRNYCLSLFDILRKMKCIYYFRCYFPSTEWQRTCNYVAGWMWLGHRLRGYYHHRCHGNTTNGRHSNSGRVALQNTPFEAGTTCSIVSI